MMMSTGAVERVQRTGAGILDLASGAQRQCRGVAHRRSASAPGRAISTAGEQLTLTNLGKKTDTFTISATAYDDAPPLLFSPDPNGAGAARLITLNIAPGQSKTIYAIWRFAILPPGEYQGLISVQGSADARPAFVPYWHAIPAGTPRRRHHADRACPTQYPAGRSLTVYFRIVDSIGIPVVDPQALHFLGSAVSGGGSVASLTLSDSISEPGVYRVRSWVPIQARTFSGVSFGNLPPRTFNITGTKP